MIMLVRKITLIISLFVSVICLNAQTYVNYAEGKSITTSTDLENGIVLTDGTLITGPLKVIPIGKIYTIEMDLTAEFKIGGVHLYIDVKDILPIRNFEIQYKLKEQWIDIPEADITDNFRDKIRIVFNKLIFMNTIRIRTKNDIAFGLLEWQVWGEDVPEIPFQIEIEKPEPFVAGKHWICVNQVGYNIDAPKRFTVPTAITDLEFTVIEKESERVVYRGTLNSGEGDFTEFNPVNTENNEYIIQVKGDGLIEANSYPFVIGKHALQNMAYQSAVDFFIDSRSIMGTHPSAYGGTAWRDGTYYTYEVPSLVILYLSNPKVFDLMPVTINWDAEKETALSPHFKHFPERGDHNPMAKVKGYYEDLPEPKNKNTPDIIQCIRYGIGWNFIDPVSEDPSGDPLGRIMHGQTIEQFAYFLYGYPVYKKYIGKEFYQAVLDSTLNWWDKSGLFDVIAKVGSPKGRHAPGHSIMPNLLMYEVANRENLDNAQSFLKAAQDQTRWMIDNANWNNPVFSKGQRMSEHKIINGLAHFQYNYSELAPKGLKQMLIAWAEKVVSLSNNMWDFRKFNEDNYTLPGYNEAGNVIGFPACVLSVAMILDDGDLKNKLVEIAYAHYDNFMGRNPQNASAANFAKLGFEGLDSSWPFPDKRVDVCARLELTRGSLSSLPGSEMYPFNPNGRPRHGEGWTAYNACWNLSIAYMNFYEGISSFDVFRGLK